jgi:hypothetical protein
MARIAGSAFADEIRTGGWCADPQEIAAMRQGT